MIDSDQWGSRAASSGINQPMWVTIDPLTGDFMPATEDIVVVLEDASKIALTSGNIQDLSPLLEVVP